MQEFTRVDGSRKNDSIGKGGVAERSFKIKNASRIRGAGNDRERQRNNPTRVSVSYYNYVGEDIVVTTRDGTSARVPSSREFTTDEFIVCVTRTMTRAAMQQAMAILKAKPNFDDTEIFSWFRAYDIALDRDKSRDMISASVEYIIYHRDMVDASGRCYMPDVDLLVEFGKLATGVHPFDKIKRNEATIRDLVPGAGDGSFVFMLKAVDNSPHAHKSTRYVNYGGDVYAIPIEYDLNYENGIHLVTRSPVVGGRLVNDIISLRYSFEEADAKFGLHRTIEDAEMGGPMNEMAKAIIDHQSTLKRVEEARMRNEQLSAEQLVQRLKNEGHILKALQEKDNADRRNYVEWAKTAAALLGVTVSIYGILSSLTSK